MDKFLIASLIIVGSFFSLQWYLKATRQERFQIKQFADLELMKEVVRENRYTKETYRIISVIGVIVWSFALLNYQFDAVPAWWIVVLAGIAFALSNYLFQDLKRKSLRNLAYKSEQNSDILMKIKDFDHQISKSFLITLLVTVLVAGNWSFQINKNTRMLQDDVKRELARLSGNGWCNEFADINVFDGGETVVKDGGWPCILVGSVSGIEFSKKDKEPVVCFYTTFNVHNSPPGLDSYAVEQGFEKFCATRTIFGGWDEDSLLDQIGEYVRPQLPSLATSLCREFSLRMSYESFITYCRQ